MTEERITRVETPEGNTHTSTTIVTDKAESRGAAPWLILVVLIIAVAAGIWIFSGMSDAEVAKDQAVTNAAESVNDAANSVGDAAGQVGDAVEQTADNIQGQ